MKRIALVLVACGFMVATEGLSAASARGSHKIGDG
jgi:hypothetical protein